MSPDDIEAELEVWAAWRCRHMEQTLGDSMLARLKDPPACQPPQSRPLIHGNMNDWPSTIDQHLTRAFRRRAVQALVIAYSVPDGWKQAARLCDYSDRQLRRLRSKARDIVQELACRSAA